MPRAFPCSRSTDPPRTGPRINIHLTVNPMQKLSLKLDDLSVQSFETTPALDEIRCTVRGHMDDASHDECSDACGSQIYTCLTCDTCDDACNDDGPVEQRRIILY